MKRILIPITLVFLFLTAIPSNAKVSPKNFDDTLIIVRNSLIARGITAYKIGNYQKAVDNLNQFINTRRVIATPTEIAGYRYLALAYQKLGKEQMATKTIIRAIAIFGHYPVELAHLESTAGAIASEQQQTEIAVKHWEKARQLYLTNNFTKEWSEITFKLAKSYQELGNLAKSRKMLAELEQTNIDIADLAVSNIQ